VAQKRHTGDAEEGRAAYPHPPRATIRQQTFPSSAAKLGRPAPELPCGWRSKCRCSKGLTVAPDPTWQATQDAGKTIAVCVEFVSAHQRLQTRAAVFKSSAGAR